MIKKIVTITGLGNLGREYNNTRHNLGIYFINRFAKKYNTKLKFINTLNLKIAIIIIGEVMVYLTIPITYMNISGHIIMKYIKYFKFYTNELIVVHDDLNLNIGTAKFKYDGNHGGHNGIKNIIERLGFKKFYRLKIGISRPNKNLGIREYVLARIINSEKIVIDNVVYKIMLKLENFLFINKFPNKFIFK